MLGSVRFLLALLVMLSHFPPNGLPLNVGVVAVICFYFISGFLMRRSYERFESNSNHPIWTFYVDRVLRLFPQYLLVCWASFALIYLLGRETRVPYLAQEITPLKVVLNTLLLPTNYVFPPFVVPALLPHPIIPPAWSLASEFHFYLLLPLLFRAREGVWMAWLIGAAAIQWGGFWSTNPTFATAAIGYRYILGVLVVFLFGYGFAETGTRKSYAAWGVWAGYLVHLLLSCALLGLRSHPLVLEVALGGAIALPLTHLSMRWTWRSRTWQTVDRVLGDLAYPIFISHFLAYYLVEQLFGLGYARPVSFFLVSLSFCSAVSWGLMRTQRRFDAYRIDRRGFESLTRGQVVSA